MTTSVEEKLKASTNSLEDALQPRLTYPKFTEETARQMLPKGVTSQSASKIPKHQNFNNTSSSLSKQQHSQSHSKIKNRSISSIHPPEVMKLKLNILINIIEGENNSRIFDSRNKSTSKQKLFQ